MKKAGPSGWRGVMSPRPQPSDFGLSPLADNVDSLTQRTLHKPKPLRIQNGIGGGMRFTDDSVFGNTSPSSCFSRSFMDRRLSLTGRRVVAGIYCTILLTVLLVGHVHLRFQIHDIKMQEHMLQTVQQQLDRRLSTLDRGVAHRLGDLGPLRDVAVTRFNMVPNAGRSVELAIAPEAKERYAPDRIAETLQVSAQQKALARQAPQGRLSKLADFALAFIPERRQDPAR